ncbi:MAG: hypothetical protein SGPRY_000695 [Prymnesium sp.]
MPSPLLSMRNLHRLTSRLARGDATTPSHHQEPSSARGATAEERVDKDAGREEEGLIHGLLSLRPEEQPEQLFTEGVSSRAVESLSSRVFIRMFEGEGQFGVSEVADSEDNPAGRIKCSRSLRALLRLLPLMEIPLATTYLSSLHAVLARSHANAELACREGVAGLLLDWLPSLVETAGEEEVEGEIKWEDADFSSDASKKALGTPAFELLRLLSVHRLAPSELRQMLQLCRLRPSAPPRARWLRLQILQMLGRALGEGRESPGCGYGASVQLSDETPSAHRCCGLQLPCSPLVGKGGFTMTLWLLLPAVPAVGSYSVVCSVAIDGREESLSDPLVLTMLAEEKALMGLHSTISLGSIEMCCHRWHLLTLSHGKNLFGQVNETAIAVVLASAHLVPTCCWQDEAQISLNGTTLPPVAAKLFVSRTPAPPLCTLGALPLFVEEQIGVLSGSDLVALHSQGPEPPWAYVSLSVRRGERKLNVEAVVPAQLAEKLAPRLVGRCV